MIKKEKGMCHKWGMGNPLDALAKRENTKKIKSKNSSKNENPPGDPKLTIPPPNRAKNNIKKIKLLWSISMS